MFSFFTTFCSCTRGASAPSGEIRKPINATGQPAINDGRSIEIQEGTTNELPKSCSLIKDDSPLQKRVTFEEGALGTEGLQANSIEDLQPLSFQQICDSFPYACDDEETIERTLKALGF
ncbi:hypothetical protein [Endozoicomonas atrinae]|uniref:hypothetical protein n=1 Tax=Endozoicomonas atrinae TaxID=1333660 RepID=UPI000A3DD3EC|nr:hypothetical protein [Endozoicomonas atrinae]